MNCSNLTENRSVKLGIWAGYRVKISSMLIDDCKTSIRMGNTIVNWNESKCNLFKYYIISNLMRILLTLVVSPTAETYKDSVEKTLFCPPTNPKAISSDCRVHTRLAETAASSGCLVHNLDMMVASSSNQVIRSLKLKVNIKVISSDYQLISISQIVACEEINLCYINLPVFHSIRWNLYA